MEKSKNKEIPTIMVGKYAGTKIDQLPNSYLRWMLTQDFPKEWIDIALRKLKDLPYSNEHINITRHAIDQFSLRFLHVWQVEGNGMGLGSFMAKEAQEAWIKGKDISKNRHKDDGISKLWNGIVWVFNVSPYFHEYKDVITCGIKNNSPQDNSLTTKT